mgnify:CR=1 FL=1|tara:strand:+ start:177 stop:812 length:636 start_codon:yes stop_codon:yes gene_type:complete
MNIRLIYFDMPFWRAEASRIALFLGGIPFDDVRTTGEEFEKLKTAGTLPYGQLPVLEVDGTVIAQSVAIARFCGKQAGLYPMDNDVNAARVDELLDTATQITELLSPSFGETDSGKRAAMRDELASQTLPTWLGFLESRLISNRESGYFVGPQLTIADLAIWRLLGWITGGHLDGIPTNLLDSHPKLDSHFQNIDGHDGVRSWMDQHYADR